MSAATIRITPLSAAVGAVIHGVDLAEPVAEDRFAEIRQAFADHGVIFFRDQRLSPEQHLAFARRWAPVVVNRFFKPVPGHPEIAEIRKDADQTTNIGGDWHTDHSYDAAPAMGSLLLARELPPSGGDTLFAHMGAAYDALPPELKRELRALKAVHSTAHVFGPQGGYAQLDDVGERIGVAQQATNEATHPVVIRHPETGRATLYVNPAFTVRFEGWTRERSEPLLRDLYQHASQPEFSARFQWQPGSLALWDNRATWHRALNDYPGHRRVMHRITVAGVPISGVSG
jgi:taurine dioxygenase